MKEVKWQHRTQCVLNKQIDKKKRTRKDDNLAVVQHDRRERGGTPPEAESCSPSFGSDTTTQRMPTRVVRRGGAEGDHPALPSPTDPLTKEDMFKGTLTKETVRMAAGTRQLRDVARLALVIDSSETSVDGVWAALPRLHTLVLDGSRLLSFRDLGVGLRHLNTLSLESSCVKDLDGIAALSGLRELHLAHNRVSDVTPLACHGNLQILGLERNRISDMNAVEILGTLPLLYSLDLRENPLMESLGRLLDGRGRGVVHQLIPQIRILDRIHLSGESSSVGAETLHEAEGLIREGAFFARSVWAEEDAAAEIAADRQREQKAHGSLPESVSCHQRRSKEVELEMALDAGKLHSTADHGIVHWDSDLTQGGGQAFSGSPSLAIRRHKLETDVGRRRNKNSATQVLETLDLAKMMEQGLKERHAQSADRVLEWQRETCSDSLPQEDPPAPPVRPAPSSLKPLPLSSSKQLPSRATHYGRSTSPVSCERRGEKGNGAETRAGSAGSKGKRGVNGDGSWGSPSTWACSSMSTADGEHTQKALLADTNPSLGRPWTTGAFCSRSTPTAASSTLFHAPSLCRVAGNHEMEHEEQVVPVGPGSKVHLSLRRPQTAREPGECCGPLEATTYSESWKPVWESLQAAQLVTPNAEVATQREGSTGESAREEDDRLRSVDFQKQRRERAARTGIGTMGGLDGDLDESGSVSAEEAGSSESEEVGSRNQIKRKASEYSCKATATSAAASLNVGPTSSPCSPREPVAKDCADRTHSAPSRPQICAENNRPLRTQRREIATMESHSLYMAMDDCSSSSGEDRDCDKLSELADKQKAHRASVGGGDVVGSGIECNTGGSSTRRISSIHASRMLGFDLRKSLAAIDEWTDKATTTVRDVCRSTPRERATLGGQPVSCFVEHTSDVSSRFSSKIVEQDKVEDVLRNAAVGYGGGTMSQNPRARATALAPASSNINGKSNNDSSDDGSEGEAVLSVAAARAALGISKGAAAAATFDGSSGGASVGLAFGMASATFSAGPTTSSARRPSPSEIDVLLTEGGRAVPTASGREKKCKGKGGRKTGRRISTSSSLSGLAVGMSDEALESMLRRQPRTVPELRTKESFRDFFQGMKAERMSRLLRGAYEGTLPGDEVEKKVEKRLGLVDDILAW